MCPIQTNSKYHAKDTRSNSTSEAAAIHEPAGPEAKSSASKELLSKDCFARRNEILSKQQHSIAVKIQQAITFNGLPPGFQRLKPKLNGGSSPVGSPSTSVQAIPSPKLPVEQDNEHVPQCTSEGKYEPVQCHKIGYCWCVNKYGQAIKNSGAAVGEQPSCDMAAYESDNYETLVVSGMSANRLKNLLKSSNNNGNTTEATINNQTFESISYQDKPDYHMAERDGDGEFSRRVSKSAEPHLALVPNECDMSRNHARERAAKHMNDDFWIPACDNANPQLYAERQCHKNKVCWCVSQITGLPVRTNDKLDAQPDSLDCSKTVFGLEKTTASPQIAAKPVYVGFSEYCDAEKRADFVSFLINQFKQHLIDLYRPGHAHSDRSQAEEATSLGMHPSAWNESFIAQMKFVTLDYDHDRKLDYREWLRFKSAFKVVEQPEDALKYHELSQQTNGHLALSPLGVLRSQRRCWRDFLQHCGNGDLFTDEAVTIDMWMNCTETPTRQAAQDNAAHHHQAGRHGQPIATDLTSADYIRESIYANTEEAAQTRKQKKNPFLGILKPD